MINSRTRQIWETIISFLIFFGIDRISKILVLNAANQIELTSFLSFDITINRGIAWGLFHTESTLGFLLVSGVIGLIICAMLWYAYKQLCYGSLAIEEMLILAGAIGNLVDRIVYTGVIDFIHFHFGSYNFPIFNLADVFIFMGIVWVMVKHYDK